MTARSHRDAADRGSARLRRRCRPDRIARGRRVEVAFPVRSEELRRRIEEHIFALARGDNVKSWRLDPDGRYHRVTPDGPPVRGQEALIARAREHSFHIERYEKAARRPPRFRKRVLRARRWEIRGLRDPAQ